MSYLSISYVNR